MNNQLVSRTSIALKYSQAYHHCNINPITLILHENFQKITVTFPKVDTTSNFRVKLKEREFLQALLSNSLGILNIGNLRWKISLVWFVSFKKLLVGGSG